MRARYYQAALADVRGAVRYLNSRRPGLGNDFKTALVSALRSVRTHPRAWHEVAEGVRGRSLTGFSYAVLYWIEADGIAVIGVIHHKQDPAVWMKRLEL